MVASDRYRLAVATVVTRNHNGPPARLIAPTSLLDEPAPSSDEDFRVSFNGCTLSIGAAHALGIDAVFPDYQRLLQTSAAQEVAVDTADLIERLKRGPTRTMVQAPNDGPHEVSIVLVDGESIQIVRDNHPNAVGLNRAFLLQALATSAADRVVFAIDGPISALAIRNPARSGDVSLLMPTRLA